MHADWEIWTAGTVTSSGGRDQFIQAVRNYAASGKNSAPFGDLYQTTDGTQLPNSGRARPVVGGHLALLALSEAPIAVSAPSPAINETGSSGRNAAARAWQDGGGEHRHARE